MNYANMIEEKNLKKTFIIATLCSTLVGTFTSSIGLWDRVKNRREQHKRDVEQDEEIKKLRSQIEEAEGRNRGHGQRHRSLPPPRDRDWDRDWDSYGPGRDYVGDSLERSGALISREFDDGYERLGRRFAVGDAVTENKLQAQIIALQRTVINVLQDALADGRQLDRRDMALLVAASDTARDQSLDALRQQRQRLAYEAPTPPRQLEYRSQPASSSTTSSTASLETDSLFCRYSLDLQYLRNKPLSGAFSPSGDGRCPACDVRLDVEPDDCWAIEKRERARVRDHGRAGDVLEEREFQLGQRFVVKCHMPDGRFACLLCTRFRSRDTICSTVDGLVNHVGKDHDMGELESEEDFEMRSRRRPLLKALPPP
ncbi:hypothetical protein S40288_08222 [Stachybotrys chartarum IBT 40288]|nr:hypothetical protein S40288_08222 [Stachybotrys chartarum IBT 40288]